MQYAADGLTVEWADTHHVTPPKIETVRIAELTFSNPIDPDRARRYANMPGETAPPIRVHGIDVRDGNHRLMAAFMRNDPTIKVIRVLN
jgi:hypothetical protein